jgi:hypothetical protein
VDRCDPNAIGFDIGNLGGFQPSDAGNPVCAGTAKQFLKPWHLVLSPSDDELPAPVVWDALLLAVLIEEGGSLNAETSLERAWCVIHPAVDNAGVVAGLVHRNCALFLKHEDPEPGMSEKKLCA